MKFALTADKQLSAVEASSFGVVLSMKCLASTADIAAAVAFRTEMRQEMNRETFLILKRTTTSS